jgi:hypothetical protein
MINIFSSIKLNEDGVKMINLFMHHQQNNYNKNNYTIKYKILRSYVLIDSKIAGILCSFFMVAYKF